MHFSTFGTCIVYKTPCKGTKAYIRDIEEGIRERTGNWGGGGGGGGLELHQSGFYVK
jgi:hypothetical protein